MKSLLWRGDVHIRIVLTLFCLGIVAGGCRRTKTADDDTGSDTEAVDDGIETTDDPTADSSTHMDSGPMDTADTESDPIPLDVTELMSDPAQCYPDDLTHSSLRVTDTFENVKPYPCILGWLAIANVALEEIDLPNLKWIGKKLSIRETTQLKNLNDLSSLQFVTEDVILSKNQALKSLDGLSSLQFAGSLYISQNSALKNINAISKLESVRNLTIRENGMLERLDGLDSLHTIEEKLTIADNDTLTDISGLKDLTNIGYRLIIKNNPKLGRCQICDLIAQLDSTIVIETSGNMADGCSANCTLQTNDAGCIVGNITVDDAEDISLIAPYPCIEGNLSIIPKDLESITLPNLTSVSKSVFIGDSDGVSARHLTDISGLSALTLIGNDLIIENVPLLETLTGLENLESIEKLTVLGCHSLQSVEAFSSLIELQWLTIKNNDALSTLGLESLRTITGEFWIENNPMLPQCAVRALWEQVGFNTGWTCLQENQQTNDETSDSDSELCAEYCPIYHPE